MLEFEYYGQNDGTTVPDVALTGDPAVDQPVLKAAAYFGGRIVALITSAVSGRGVVVTPCNGGTQYPYGWLINGAGNYAESIGPSGSRKTPIVRALPKIKLTNEGTTAATGLVYEASPTTAYAVGLPLYAGDGTSAPVGVVSTDKPGSGVAAVVGIVTHIPTTAEPYLGVASLV